MCVCVFVSVTHLNLWMRISVLLNYQMSLAMRMQKHFWLYAYSHKTVDADNTFILLYYKEKVTH